MVKQINQSKTLKTAAAKASMSEKTARKYRRSGKLPSQCKPIHDWKTHEDVFEDDWPWVQDFLETNSGLEAKTMFEIVVLQHGRPSFQKLQQRDHLQDPTRIEILSKRMPVRLMAFDLLYVRGRRITGQPLSERRQRLTELVGRLGHPLLIVPDCVVGHGMKFFTGIVQHRLEGMMAKRIDSPYLIGRRSSDWLKIKVAHTADFEVIGCVPTRGEKAVRALLLGEKEQGRLVYKGKVSSGLTRRQREDFMAELAKAPKLQELVDCPSGSICRLPGWRCRVRYFGLTEMGHLRSPTFEGLI